MTGTVGGLSPAADAPALEPGVRASGLATFPRRLTAYVVDAVVGVAVALAPALLLFAGAGDENRWSGPFAVVLSVVVPLAYVGLLWLMAAYGNSPGNALLGIRVVREATGSRPGAGVGLGRLLLRGLLIGDHARGSRVLAAVGLHRSTPRLVGPGCGTVVLARSAVPDYVSAAAAARLPTLAAMSLGGLPEPVPAGVPASVDGTELTGFERPAWDIAPVGAPVAAPVRAAPAASWADRPGGHPAAGRGKPQAHCRQARRRKRSHPVGPPHGVRGPAPGRGAVGTGCHCRGAGVRDSLPGRRSDHTRMRVSPEPMCRPCLRWSAVLDDGRVLTLAVRSCSAATRRSAPGSRPP